ncbi:YdeI/OmpD-associated family protein [Microbacterium sp. Au-Mic1]|uniref:YdeI/OmpD-associated family protein n=1 Tax=Microbacterium sp. Au-Mic1 TaxID=2906457 RepID=UPI001E48F338|nr:YdeI/OmpD-associated family protein [Microbacterium sp. Au-Mic1]MCE4026375.1 YdeI/OmpD-associated family protein [Microbacterium sp. Au-Mic1]
MSELRIRTVLEPMGPAGAIVLTDAQVAEISSAKAFPVAVTIGQNTARLRLARMGGKNLIGFSKANRAAMGIELGEEFDAVIAPDAAERTVDVPDALASALADAGLTAAYDALSFTRRKEIAVSVADAKQEATRDRRIAKALDELRG